MNKLDVPETDISMSYVIAYVEDPVWNAIPGFVKGFVIFLLTLLFLTWLGLNLVLTQRHFHYALAITDSRVIGFAKNQERDIHHECLVNVFVEQFLWGKRFGYGNVVVQTKHQTLTFRSRKDPKRIRALLRQIMDENQ